LGSDDRGKQYRCESLAVTRGVGDVLCPAHRSLV
jgi:hypothetical protein